MKNYDFAFSKGGDSCYIYTGCIVRRFTAALVDTVLIFLFFILFGVEGDGDINGYINFLLYLWITVVPEFAFRQSLGMYLCGIVVIVPPSEDPKTALLIRKVMNMVEFCLPSALYYFMVSFSEGNRSISDQVSGCIIARKKYLLEGCVEKPKLNKFTKVIVPIVFTIFPICAFIGIPIALVFLFTQSADVFEAFLQILKYFNIK